jgi:uncharacterized protein (DUF2147 family)
LIKLLIAITLIISAQALGQSCIGKWITIDDETGKQKSIVELYKQNDKLFGKITYVFPNEIKGPNPKCTKCTDDRKDQPILGLQIVRSLKWNGGSWEGGTIVDPENGKIYDVKMWIDPQNSNRLNVRGYIGPFLITQYLKIVVN